MTARCIGLIGLGRMGLPLCRRLVDTGFAVTASDLRPEVSDEVTALGADWTASGGEAAERSDVLITLLPGPGEVRSVLPQVAPQLASSATWIEMSSATPAVARAIQAAAQTRGFSALDVPVGGNPQAAGEGRLVAFAGGEPAVIDGVAPVLDSITEQVLHVGAAGCGYAVKLLVNLLWFGQAVAAAEALALAERLGVGAETLRAVVGDSAAASRFMATDARALLAGDDLTTFSLARCCEELNSVLAMGSEQGMTLELASLVEDLHRRALRHYGEVDGELLAARLIAERAGVSFGSGESSDSPDSATMGRNG